MYSLVNVKSPLLHLHNQCIKLVNKISTAKMFNLMYILLDILTTDTLMSPGVLPL